MVDYYNDSQEMNDEGPIIQEIPDGLMVGDYIEIHGICRGNEVLVELLARDKPRCLPLHARFAVGGPAFVESKSQKDTDHQECNVRMGLQRNQNFVLCIHATEKGYDLKLNGEHVCFQKYMVDLQDVSTISMDGDADFTSVEFKDIYGDEEDLAEAASPGANEAGVMRVQEMRQSLSRNRGSPAFVRSSVRRSQRSNAERDVPHAAWPTQEDLSRPQYDIDTGKEISARNNVPAIGQSNNYAPIPVEQQTYVEQPSPKSKNHTSWKPGSRKSYTVEQEKPSYKVVGSSVDPVVAGVAHRGTYESYHDENVDPSQMQTIVSTSGGLGGSTKSLADSTKKKRSSLFGKHRKSKGSETDIRADGSEKTKKRGIRNPFKSRKSVTVPYMGEPTQSYSMPDVRGRDSALYTRLSTDNIRRTQQPYFGAAADNSPVRGPVPKSVCKQPAPEIAGYLAGQKALPEFENFSLTQRELQNLPPLSYAAPVASSRSSTYPDSHPDKKLEGTAPEIADTLVESRRAGFDQKTTLTSGQLPSRTSEYHANVGYVEPYAVRSSRNLNEPAPMVAASLDDDERYRRSTNIIVDQYSTPSHTKLNGTAPELASTLRERQPYKQDRYADSTITGTMAEPGYSHPVIERPIIDRDTVLAQKPTAYQSQPLYETRPVSVGRHPPTRNDSDRSSVHSDGEYYLEVGRSDYYFERMRSLKNYRSMRSRKNEQRLNRNGSLDGSARSSVSSLKDTDKVIYPRKPRQNFDHNNQVNSWLSNYEDDIRPTQRQPKVYATPTTCLPTEQTTSLQLNKDYTIPITLDYPEPSVNGALQTMSFNTRMDADAERILLEFETQSCEKFDLIMDVKDGYIFARAKHDENRSRHEHTAKQSIPFVPEQIHRVSVMTNTEDNTLTVTANQKEIFKQALPFATPCGKLSHVRLSGDMLLLGVYFE